MILSQLLNGLMVLDVQGDTQKQVSRVESSESCLFETQGAWAKDNTAVLVHVGPLLPADLERYFHNHVHMLVVDRAITAPRGTTVIRLINTAHAYAQMASMLSQDPSRQLTVIGVTGTNGKTTVTHLIDSMLQAAGCHTALFGSLGYRLGTERVMEPQNPQHLTTPQAGVLQNYLRQAVESKITHAVMEVSSTGLAEHRVSACHFDVGVFTNCTAEHLDEHLSFDHYFERKCAFFTHVLRESQKNKKTACINMSDPRGKKLARRISKPLQFIGYARRLGTGQSVYFRRSKLLNDGIQAEIATPRGLIQVQSPLLGPFHLMNILSAVSAGLALDLSTADIEEGIRRCRRIPGRLERVANTLGLTVYFDWAHSVEAYRQLLLHLRKWKGHGRLLVAFGCEDRMAPAKRSAIAAVAAKHSDQLFIALQNLAGDARTAVESQMLDGMKIYSTPRRFYENPLHALTECFDAAKPGDTVAVVGWDIEHANIAEQWLAGYAEKRRAL